MTKNIYGVDSPSHVKVHSKGHHSWIDTDNLNKHVNVDVNKVKGSDGKPEQEVNVNIHNRGLGGQPLPNTKSE